MNFATLHFDTYKVVTLLKERGFTKKQAEGIMEAVQEVTISGVATKEDVRRVEAVLQQDIHRVEAVLQQDIHRLETELRSEIAKVETGLRSEIAGLRSEIQKAANGTLKFQIIQTITIVGVMVALFSLFLIS